MAKPSKKYIINIIVVLLMTTFTVYYLLKSNIVTEDAIKQINWYYFLIIFGLAFLSLIIYGFIDLLVYRTFTDKLTFGIACMGKISGALGSSVTPFKSGHFPLMLYCEHRLGVPITDVIIGTVKSQIIHNISTILLYTVNLIVLIVSRMTLNINGTIIPLWIVPVIGLTTNIFIFSMICLAAYNKTFQVWVLILISKIIKIFKKSYDREKFITEKQERLIIYRNQLDFIKHNLHKYIVPIIVYLINLIFSGLLEYFSFILISGKPIILYDIFLFYVLHLATLYIGNVIPIPGGAVIAEALFTMVFGTVILDSSTLGAVLVLWRVSTFYIVAVVNLLLFAIFTLSSKSKNQNKKTDIYDKKELDT